MSGPAAVQTGAKIAPLPSPNMDAADAPLVCIAQNALVSEEAAAYLNLPEDSPQSDSYDTDLLVRAADGVWTVGTGPPDGADHRQKR